MKIKEERWLNYLTISLVVGVLLMSLGIYLVGIHFPHGNILLAVASAIVYISVIILAFKV
jgi:hypothetical protein